MSARNNTRGIGTGTPLLLAILLTAGVAGIALGERLAPEAAAQSATSIGVDPYVLGNTTNSLGPRQRCVSVDRGEEFPIDVWVADVTGLAHWEMYLDYDSTIVQLLEVNVQMFLASEPGSRLFTLSEPIRSGRYFLGAADFSSARESGSGTLARVTLRATGSGLTSLDIPSLDEDGDGDIDLGPRLTDRDGPLGDTTGDGVFDGTIETGLVAVDQPCPSGNTTPKPTPRPTGAGGSQPDASASPGASQGPGPDPDADGNGNGSGGGSQNEPTSTGPASSPAVFDPGAGNDASDGGSGLSGSGTEDDGDTVSSASTGGGGVSWLVWAALGVAALIVVGAGAWFLTLAADRRR